MFDSSSRLRIAHLVSGGLITNYFCTSQCGHCLYRCSPTRERAYVDRETLEENIEKIQSLGCRSVHVGGGEPFLDLAGLKMVLGVSAQMGMRIEYVETNSSWFKNRQAAAEILDSLAHLGLTTLLVSMSPFHNEHIAFSKVKGVIQACEDSGIRVFPWIWDFFDEVNSFDDSVPHTLHEYTEKFGQDYVRALPSRYWVHLGGRALDTFGQVWAKQKCERLLSSTPGGCSELLEVTHFHVDLYGNYVPGLCAGLAFSRDDLGRALDPDAYPFLSTLFLDGINGLFKLAKDSFGFDPSDEYLNKCDLCSDIRRHLVVTRGVRSRDLAPLGHYLDWQGT